MWATGRAAPSGGGRFHRQVSGGAASVRRSVVCDAQRRCAATCSADAGRHVLRVAAGPTPGTPHRREIRIGARVWLYPKGMKGPPFPIDLSKESGDVHLLVKSLRLACEKPREQRSEEAEYVQAAKRFKAAVRGLKGSMAAAVKQLNAASAELEKLARKKSEL